MAAPSLPAVQIQINPPRLFTAWAVLGVIGYGLLLALPVLLVTVVVVCMPKYGVVTYLVPLGAMAAATMFLPLGFGNVYVARLVRSLRPGGRQEPGQFIVQLTLVPRLRSGLRALLEDADDIGWLGITESALVFEGDSVQLSVPFEYIQEVRPQTIGWRGLFVCGARLRLEVPGMPKATRLEFAERSSWWVPTSRQTAQMLYRSVTEKVSKRS
ncbi:MAG TPA: hypothetical protein VN578_20710 [Candidatus Binatia bacterium]|jgi:hypothetical protein|nr:hypothetical protein [Candidatus Binatia bacterium]